ncbi:hypothetical protein EC973_008586 [Apophysomyces ossiformis]|uniref:Bifunctional lycopene cyclase/phytoene synthase n=1 Tax=Apophysomyces ossiformis TaxID=679940 RepID=A0A8H7BT78_9FUNG|nr:hypothetical protein EC973_008586 [Apophysomyces ossiformis]
MAFGTATPWDNYIVYHRAWSYCPNCVVAVIGYVPLEEYMFFVIMTVTTVTFTNLIMRWHLPSTFIVPDAPVFKSMCIRYLPIVAFLGIGAKAWLVTAPETHRFYAACILWYACPVLGLLWFGSGEYICRRWPGVLTSILVPTAFLCWVDQIAIGAGTWHISLRTSTGLMVARHLPLEEFMFFFLINTVLVFATCAIDRANAILQLYQIRKLASKHQAQSTIGYFIDLTWAFLQSDQALDPEPLRDLDATWDILKKSSRSFYTASAIFPFNIRQDLGVLYGFCRATDDLIDNENVPLEKRKEQLNLVRHFVHELFSQKTNRFTIQWKCYKELPSSCLVALRCFTRLRPTLEVDAIQELLDGYAWDLDRRPVVTEQDLIRYSACVASSVGEMCSRIILLNNDKSDLSCFRWTIARARDMGLVLQFINIARDIVTDSQQLGRCYIPRKWLTEDEYHLLLTGAARKISDARLRQLSLTLVHAANDVYRRAGRGILRLPTESQAGIRTACAVYSAIGDVLQRSKGYPTRAYINTWERMWIVLKSVYSSEHSHPTPRKGKMRSFVVE